MDLAPPPKDREGLPVFISADSIAGRTEDEVTAEGNVVLRRLGNTLKADRLTYRQSIDEVDAQGNVRLTSETDAIAGPHLRLQLEKSLGFFERPVYSISRPPRSGQKLEAVKGGGEAERLDFEGEDLFRLRNATFSSCGPDDPDWYLKGRDVLLDYRIDEGVGRDVRLVFMGVPLFYTPYVDFPLNNRRKTGLLPPTIGSSSKTGLDLTLPWYWNIAPNQDVTFAPRFLSRRGLQLNTEYRYLQPEYTGSLRVEWLPKDTVTNTARHAYALQHTHVFRSNVVGQLNLNGVSDDTYLTDLGTRVATSAQSQLLRQGVLAYGCGWWTATALMQRYQTLQDPALPPVVAPYDRLPQLTLLASRPEFYGDSAFAFSGEFVSFHHPTMVLGRRLTAYPQISLPLQTSAFYVTPKFGYHLTRYGLSRQAADVPDTLTRSVPIFSVDGGVTFERDARWLGRDMVQTLEPRLYYLRVPHRDQGRIPVFDTGIADFNFTQIFAENSYVGGDRISDANQLTTALVSRIINPATGAELMRGAVGSRYYFRDQTVDFPGLAPRTGRRADLLAALSGEVLRDIWFDSGVQYNPRSRHTERLTVGARYQPAPGRVFNTGYRYTRDVLREVDVSAQWPLWRNWYGVARYNYSLKENRLIEAIGGLEYDGGCWVGRVVVHRYAAAAQVATSALFVQLEFNGFSRIGSNPLELLRRSVSGYGLINRSVSDPVFGAD
ncbi:MAG: LPS-assembly protein LptD [Betaproteobacteria bacterium]|nr:LPS-assembly protein LptD [Betaproteobacteria bacterium]